MPELPRAAQRNTALLGAPQIRELAAELGVSPTKKLGQNFVIDPNTIRKIIAAAQLGENETVVEIGPGLGSLTLGLMDAAGQVVAVEIDSRLAAKLPHTIAQYRPEDTERLSVIEHDALSVGEIKPTPSALVANLPYNVAVPVLLTVLAENPSIRHGLVMVQEEVADRMVAAPGSRIYGIPSLKLAWYAAAHKAGVVGKNVFWPAPNVSSALVYFARHPQVGEDSQRRKVFAVIDQAFSARRKSLRAGLANWAGSASRAEELLLAAGISPQQRAEQLGIADFVRLSAAADAADPAPSKTASPQERR